MRFSFFISTEGKKKWAKYFQGPQPKVIIRCRKGCCLLRRFCFEVFTALRVSEQLRQSKRELSRSVRELDKQRLLIEAEEGKLLGEIRKLAETQKLVGIIYALY